LSSVAAALVTRRRPFPKVPARARPSRPFHRTASRTGQLSSQQGAVSAGALATILAFASQTVLITALLYYFGWVRTQADFGYFGVDTSLLGYTTADYLLRSVDSAFPPLAVLALVALLLLSFHRWVVVRAVAAPVNTLIGKVLIVFVSTAPLFGVTLAAVVLARLLFPDKIGWPLGLALSIMLISAVGVLGYSQHLRSLRLAALGRRPEDRHGSSQTRAGAVVLVTLGLLGVLWWLALYATQVGERIAVDSVEALQDQPEIIIYSSDRIALAGPGIVVDEIQQAGSKYRYRYGGLRLLVQAGGKYILIPVGWQKGRDSVFLVQGNDAIRLDIISR
jgi:hypothetical protein